MGNILANMLGFAAAITATMMWLILILAGLNDKVQLDSSFWYIWWFSSVITIGWLIYG